MLCTARAVRARPVWMLLCLMMISASSATTATIGLVWAANNPIKRAIKCAMDSAVAAVNSDTSLLSGVTLASQEFTSNCSRADSINAAYSALDATPIALVGPGCSSSAATMAPILAYEQLPFISYSATSATLSDKSSYPWFLRSVSNCFSHALSASLTLTHCVSLSVSVSHSLRLCLSLCLSLSLPTLSRSHSQPHTESLSHSHSLTIGHAPPYSGIELSASARCLRTPTQAD